MRLGLALSGGGFRATLFHLGVIRYLRVSGLLKDVAAVTGVSGGSIMAGHLVLNWSQYEGSKESFDSASREIVRFASTDIRGRILRRMPFLWLTQLVPQSVPFAATLRTTSTNLLRKYLDEHLFRSCGMSEIGDPKGVVPGLYVVATNLSKAGSTCFSQGKLLHIPLGSAHEVGEVKAPLTSLALAVSASSALPGFFPPIQISDQDIGSNANEFERETFTDGGVADNLAVNIFPALLEKELDFVVVSDAGRSFVDPDTERGFGLFRTALRATDLMMFRIREMALGNAGTNSGHKYRVVSISEVVDPAKDSDAAPIAVQSQLERLRTDLDPFSSLEAEELIRHGFCVARAVVSGLHDGVDSVEMTAWAPLKGGHRGTGDQMTPARRLQSGSRRRWRLFALSDWVSWLHMAAVLAALVIAVVYLPSGLEKIRRLYDYAVAYRLVSEAPPPWESRPAPPIAYASSLTRPDNPGFTVLSEHRVWDLRRLIRASPHSLDVVGRSLLTRTALVVRNDANADSYRYWYQTSSRYFNAWSLNDRFPITLATQHQKTLTGLSLLRPWQVTIDVSEMPARKETLISVQSETEDAFKGRGDWWAAMAITDQAQSASMRVVFPMKLPFRNPEFRMFPNDSPLEATVFEGRMLRGREQTELVWEIDRPHKGYTYKIQWDW